MSNELERSLLDVERKHGISLEQADWETRQPPTEIEIDSVNEYAVIPLSVIKEKWGFVPGTANMIENKEMHKQLRNLAHIITGTETIPSIDVWTGVSVNDESVCIFWGKDDEYFDLDKDSPLHNDMKEIIESAESGEPVKTLTHAEVWGKEEDSQ